MTRIKTRNPTGGEYSFYSREEFAKAIEGGGVTPEWQVYHSASGRWLPISAHPAFGQVRKRRESGPQRPPQRTSDLVLIYPESDTPRPRTSAPQHPPTDETDPVLDPAEIDRVLRPRPSRRISVETPERRWSAAVPRLSDPGTYPTMKAESFEEPVSNGRSLRRVLVATLVLIVVLAAMSAMRGKPKQSPPPVASETRASPPPPAPRPNLAPAQGR
jgi:hypothetical protein